MVLIRAEDSDSPLASLETSGELNFVEEDSVEAFPNGEAEFIALSGVRTLAILVTPTCRLAEDHWLFSPLLDLKDNPQVKRDTLFSTSGGYSDLFGIYPIPKTKVDTSFVSFHNVVSVPSQPFRKAGEANRLSTLGKEAQDLLAGKFAEFGGRGWGYSRTDTIENEGYYRCRICVKYYGLDHKTIYLRKGDHPPECPNCKAVRTSESWELLLKHKKSRKPSETESSAAAEHQDEGRLQKLFKKLKPWGR